MKFIVLFLLLVPVHTFAATSVTVTNSGTSVSSHTSASASTGGNSGEHVVTGDASASATSHIEADGEGGEVHTETEVTVNGETKKEENTQTIPTGESVVTELHVEADTPAASSTASPYTDTDVKTPGFIETLISFFIRLPTLFFK